MPIPIEAMDTDELLTEKARVSRDLGHAHDLVNRMMLSGRLKAVMREIETRHIHAAKAERI